ncbi:AraC family transcriptional regulator of adaptative response/methylated-DNA-[protein]-cysteine methyltransferase [Dyadobacter jejuensis]|uniref:methylated-DNA--[protein]-cysteine S-methyltransferase n=1 Tax=Dyadobacter jejuensis TaxID=1082580 RepID=A0A316AGA0_9BACT|nr:methylated-DNA--[protein]-cysteine S-methyltransferase [Dyadobacter jejuensis]PWJ56816.1 AraC family transcriptional regulator of adaptative response/methylated-DNA-[protein]-cysteine methyltransferase [Dyadobacter jejuensis]
MSLQQNIDYQRIALAIDYIQDHFQRQPSLDEIAAHVHLSPYHFQRLFTEWAGVSPKKFLQYISLSHAKKVLSKGQATLFDAVEASGLSGTGRLHDLFVRIEAMTPGEYKNGGLNLKITYSHVDSPFGQLFVASTEKGICQISFSDSLADGLHKLNHLFPNAQLLTAAPGFHDTVQSFFRLDVQNLPQIKLHLKGTAFQLQVWQALLQIPVGELDTYGGMARQMHKPGASRAVGTAIGSNPIAYLIPCHRVIQATGLVGGYRWGPTRKQAILGWEAASRFGQ